MYDKLVFAWPVNEAPFACLCKVITYITATQSGREKAGIFPDQAKLNGTQMPLVSWLCRPPSLSGILFGEHWYLKTHRRVKKYCIEPDVVTWPVNSILIKTVARMRLLLSHDVHYVTTELDLANKSGYKLDPAELKLSVFQDMCDVDRDQLFSWQHQNHFFTFCLPMFTEVCWKALCARWQARQEKAKKFFLSGHHTVISPTLICAVNVFLGYWTFISVSTPQRTCVTWWETWRFFYSKPLDKWNHLNHTVSKSSPSSLTQGRCNLLFQLHHTPIITPLPDIHSLYPDISHTKTQGSFILFHLLRLLIISAMLFFLSFFTLVICISPCHLVQVEMFLETPPGFLCFLTWTVCTSFPLFCSCFFVSPPSVL